MLGAGVGAPGPLDLERGAMLNVLAPRSWSGFPLRPAVTEALGMPVIMDNARRVLQLDPARPRGGGDGRRRDADRRALFRVLIPVSLPGIAAVAIFAFITAWGEVLFASLLTTDATRTRRR